MNTFKMPAKQYSNPIPRRIERSSSSIFKSSSPIIQKKEYIIKECEFPEMTIKNCEEKKKRDETLNYKEASLKETSNVIEWKREKGWHYLYKNKNGHFIKEYVPLKEYNDEKNIHEEMNIAIEKMQDNWNLYKKRYIELHGEDEYENTYEMKNYEHMPDYYFDEELDFEEDISDDDYYEEWNNY